MEKENLIEKSEYVEIWEDNGKFDVVAKTADASGSFFLARGNCREDAVKEIRKNIKKDGDDLWLLKDKLLINLK